MLWYELIPQPRNLRTDADGSVFLKQAKAAADAIGLSSRPGWFDWWRHDDGCRLIIQGERRWLGVGERYGKDAAVRMARAANATARPCDEPADVLNAPNVWAHAFVPIGTNLSRTARDDQPQLDETRIDPDPDTVIVLNVRRFGWVEAIRNKNWVSDEMNRQADSSKLCGEGVGAVRVIAGAATSRRAKDEATRAANALNLGLVPGLGAHVSRPGLGWLLACSLFELLLLLIFLIPGPAWLAVLPALGLIPLACAGVRWWMKHDSLNDVDQRPRHRWWTARMRLSRDADRKTLMGGNDESGTRRVHAYAFQRSTFPLPSSTLAALATPTAIRGASITALTDRPDMLEHADGPLLARDAENRDIRLWASALWGGVFLMGEPGAGKSNLMHGLLAWIGRNHRNGDVIVGFESKGADSIPIYRRITPGMIVIDANDPRTPMIGLLGDGSDLEKADRFAGLMQDALGVTQFGQRSRLQTRDAIMLSLTGLKDRDGMKHRSACGAPDYGDWLTGAALLLGHNGIPDARALAHSILMGDDSDATRSAVDRLHGGMNDKGRPQVRDETLYQNLSAPLNKLEILLPLGLTAPDRPMLSWETILRRSDGHADARVIINLGASVNADEQGRHRDMPDTARSLLGAILFRSLKDAITMGCAGWQAKDRRMTILIDELTDVIGDTTGDGGNAGVIAWLRDKGRAYGVRLIAGTQHALQLDDRLLATLAGLMTVGTFTLRSDASAMPGVKVLGGVDMETLESLPDHVIAFRTVGPPPAYHSQPVTIAVVPHFDAGDGLD
ncbi:hypothetical protein [Bifidobacterium sp. SO1]|uniref:hypothetical protein n=1 Tax=Bifidobacterium sp. SO1 TaxID=2809029 RepID=UPI001BDC8761|nr:hypothetical protein [Bifidobacterium sp. SO1]MBT1161842.1 hypothetical protein [Bifidobacterium sp. SO1]